MSSFQNVNLLCCEIIYLGHVIGEGTVKPLTDNLISIQNFPQPSTKKNIRQFLGKTNFYHKYIPNAAKLLEPLHALLRKDASFCWTLQCQEAFDKVKTLLSSSPILAIFDPSLPINIYTDASVEGIGAILKQVQSDGVEKPVAYFSKKLNLYQKKKKAIYIECLAIREAIRYWQYWLLGTRFQVFTDHKPLENLKINSRTDEELGDLVNYLHQFDFRVIYRTGKTNIEADCLSRNPVLSAESPSLIDCIRTANFLTLKQIKIDQLTLTQNDKTILEKGILYHVDKNKKRILLSEALGRKLIEYTHEQYGHIGVKHILNTLNTLLSFSSFDDAYSSTLSSLYYVY